MRHYSYSLNDLSCFKFENYLQSLKRMVKNSNNPIFQICKPLYELETSEHWDQELIKNKSALSTAARDKYFNFKNGDLGIVESITNLDMNDHQNERIPSKLFGRANQL